MERAAGTISRSSASLTHVMEIQSAEPMTSKYSALVVPPAQRLPGMVEAAIPARTRCAWLKALLCKDRKS